MLSQLVVNSGSNYVRSMESVKMAIWKTSRRKVVIERMCSSTRWGYEKLLLIDAN